MGPPSYLRSVVDRNVVLRRIPVLVMASGIPEWRRQTQYYAQYCRWFNSPYRLAISAQNSRQVSDVTVLCFAILPQQVATAPLTGRRLHLLWSPERRWTALHGLDEKLIVTELPLSYGTKCLLPFSQEYATDRYSDPATTLTPYSDPATTLTPYSEPASTLTPYCDPVNTLTIFWSSQYPHTLFWSSHYPHTLLWSSQYPHNILIQSIPSHPILIQSIPSHNILIQPVPSHPILIQLYYSICISILCSAPPWGWPR
jgi:hypothetical protein